jgi:hypothetical protein
VKFRLDIQRNKIGIWQEYCNIKTSPKLEASRRSHARPTKEKMSGKYL